MQHKYMHKGPDSIRVSVRQLRKTLADKMNLDDEVQCYQTFRYLSAGQAFYRVADYAMSKSSVGCDRLTAHLPGMNWVGKVDESGDASKLLVYFARPRALRGELFLSYYSKFALSKAKSAEVRAYKDFVRAGGEGPFKPPGRFNAYYIDKCDPPNKVCLRNAGSLHVARMYTVNVTQGELYYLRLLLSHLPATSYEHLRTVKDVEGKRTVYPTFREAAEACGLLSLEDEFMDALGRAVAVMGADGTVTPAELRALFVKMVLHGGESVPVQEIYDNYKYYMALDIDCAGRVRPPGRDNLAGVGGENLHQRLPLPPLPWGRKPAKGIEAEEEDGGGQYEHDDTYDLAPYPVHEYHLLRLLSELIESNSSHTLERVGLPPLGKFAQSKEGGDVPVLQGYLEDYLYVAPQSGELQGASLAELNAMRAQYIHNYPELLTGAALQALLKDVPAKGAGSFYDTCLEGIMKEEEEALFNSLYVQLNEEQKRFVDLAVKGLEYQVVRMGALMEGEEVPAPPHNLTSLHHLQARGGRGKSFVNSCLIAKALSMGLLVSCSAFTGVAAIILRRGQTCHRTYGLQLDVSEPQPSTLTTRSVQGKRLAYTALHVIDEVDSFHRYLFEASSEVTRLCVKDLFRHQSAQPFGGAMVVVSGDWHQTLPITTGITNEDVQIHSLWRSSPLFQHFTTTVLTIAQRNAGDKDYDCWLEGLSTNRADGPDPLGEDEAPPTARRVFIPKGAGLCTEDPEKALTFLFGKRPKRKSKSPYPELNPRHAVLCVLNKDVDALNDAVLDGWVKGKAYTAKAAHCKPSDVVGNDPIAHTFASPEYMKSATQSGTPNSTLRLKKGCVLVLVRNMLSSLGLVNGTKLILLETPRDGGGEQVLKVQTVPPLGSGEDPKVFFLPRISFDMVTPGGLKFIRRQFPVRLAYALTAVRAALPPLPFPFFHLPLFAPYALPQARLTPLPLLPFRTNPRGRRCLGVWQTQGTSPLPMARCVCVSSHTVCVPSGPPSHTHLPSLFFRGRRTSCAPAVRPFPL